MELEELDVPEFGPDLMGQRPAVSGRDQGIGSDLIELSHPAGGKYHRRGPEVDSPAAHLGDQTGDAIRSLQQGPDFSVLMNLDQRVASDDGGEPADQGGSGLIAAGVDHAGLGMGGLQAESQLPVRGPIEGGPHRQQFADPVGPFLGQDPDRFGIGQAVTGGESIGGVLKRAVPRPQRDRDSALCPGTGAIPEPALGQEDRGSPFDGQSPGCPEAGDTGAHDDGTSAHMSRNITAENDGRRVRSVRERGAKPRSPGPSRWVPRPPRWGP